MRWTSSGSRMLLINTFVDWRKPSGTLLVLYYRTILVFSISTSVEEANLLDILLNYIIYYQYLC